VRGYSTIVAPLTALTGGSTAFSFGSWPANGPELAAFHAIKEELISPPILAMPDPYRQFEVRADVSLHGTGAALMQDGRPIAHTSKKFSSAQKNYTTTDQELLALYHACKKWRCHLEGANHPVLLTTDHQPLVNFAKIPHPSRRQTREIQYLQTYDFKVPEYKPGATNMADP
jgi:hypothetical protein